MRNLKSAEISKIEDILTDFLSAQGFEGTTAEFDTDFAYYWGDSVITFSLIVTDRASRLFTSFCESIAPNITADIFIYSFMHELGHIITFDDIDNDTYYTCRAAKEDISKKLETASPAIADKLMYQYFNLEDELLATKAGLRYIREHSKEVSALWKELQPHIMAFYNDNLTA